MKRLFSFLFAAILFFSFSVPVAAVSYDNFVYRDGNTYLKTFILSTEDEQAQSEWVELVTGGNTVICSLTRLSSGETGDFVFLFRSDNLSEFQVIANDNSTCTIYADAVSGYWGQVYKYDGNGSYRLHSYMSGNPNTYIQNAVILGGAGYSKMEHLDISSGYMADVEGDLYIVDDLGGSESESDGVLGFLGDFWDTFKTFLLGLFVPSDGFFADWYNDIKSAFDSKFGTLSELFNSITGFFDSVDTSVTGSEFFPSEYWGGLLSWFRAVVTGLVLFLTFFVCYKKIISLMSE